VKENDAHELCQEIIVTLWKKLPDFIYDSNKGKFRNWLSTLIRNTACNHFQKINRDKKYIAYENESESHEKQDANRMCDIDSIIANEWNNYISNLAWKSLQPNFKESTIAVFDLYMNGKSPQEIAEKLNMKELTVSTYISRVRKFLKEEIERLNKELL
jgi:RNA polymerase sigma factor (sigma-70 family)